MDLLCSCRLREVLPMEQFTRQRDPQCILTEFAHAFQSDSQSHL